MLNRVPRKSGLCTAISPAELLDGQRYFDLSKKHITLGSYAQVKIDTKNYETKQSVHTIVLD